MTDFYTAQVKNTELDVKMRTELAKVEAGRAAAAAKEETERAVRIAEVEAKNKEALMRAEVELIRTRAEHADNELMLASQRRSLEQVRVQGQLKMVTVGTLGLILIFALAVAAIRC